MYTSTGGSKEEAGFAFRRPVFIGSAPVKLEIPRQPRGKIEISLRDSDGKPMDRDSATVSIFASNPLTDVDYFSDRGLDYTFDPGEYRLSIRPKLPYCVRSTSLDGGALANGRITVSPGMLARLNIGLGVDCGSVDLHTGSNGADIAFTEYALLLTGTPETPGEVLTGTTDAQGRGFITRLPPGRYFIWTWLPDAEGFSGPDITSPSARHREVIVNKGQVTSILIDPDRSSVQQ